jgi:hypothetical protein
MFKFTIVLFVVWLAPTLGVCQGLDGEFDHLSAKERSRIAKEEESGASKDERYQAVMAEAEALFQQQRFEEALLRFQEARDLRPYNVYPRVKIQDLQALIAKRDEAKSSTAPAVEPETVAAETAEPPSPREGVQPEPGLPAETHDRTPQVDRESLGNDSGTRPTTTTQRTEPTVVRTERLPEKAREPLEEGELIYMEGRAVVVERRVAQEGRIAVFRKVTHPWGAVVYFKDAAAIPERMWTEVFGSR